MTLLQEICNSYKRKQKLKKCNYGQLFEWLVYDTENKLIAKLVNPQMLDIFWTEYDLLIIDKLKTKQILLDGFWEINSLRFYHEFMQEDLAAVPIIFTQKNNIPTIRARGLYFQK